MTSLAIRGRTIGHRLLILISAAVTGVVAGAVISRVSGDRMAPWILGRATGISAYLLLVALVVLGLTLSHPRRNEFGRTSMLRMRAHIVLSVLTLALMVLHVVVLATDRYAGVGWWGAALPMGAQYRPVPVTFGIVGAWVGVLAGLSAAVAGRLPGRAWWPLHKIAGLAFVLLWLHGVYAGSDTRPMLGMYMGTGALVLMVALGRYTARRRAADTIGAGSIGTGS